MDTPIYEQETIVRFYRDEDRATVYTSDITMMNKLDKMVATSGDWYLVGMVERKPLTEEQKEAKREQLRKNVRG